jgi:hypothetical protein
VSACDAGDGHGYVGVLYIEVPIYTSRVMPLWEGVIVVGTGFVELFFARIFVKYLMLCQNYLFLHELNRSRNGDYGLGI